MDLYVTVALVLGFAPALRLLWSQTMCRLNKSPLGETINQGSQSMLVILVLP